MANEKPLSPKDLATIQDSLLPDDLAQIEAAAVMAFVNNIVSHLAKGTVVGHETNVFALYNAAVNHCSHYHGIQNPSIRTKYGEPVENLCRFGVKE